IRFSFNQSYDTGATGRFGRQSFAWELAISHPWGIGPYEFFWTRIAEEPHNVYVNVLLSYGWLGGFAFWCFVLMTAWRGMSRVFVASPNRLLLIPAISTFIPLLM